MPFAAVRDLDLYFEIHGSGPPLLVISGTGGDLRTSAPARWPLNERFETCYYDQRGLGQTSQPTAPYSMADYADDAAALLDHLNWPTARVVGISFGGMVAQNLAVRHPRRIERMVLACTSAGGAGGRSADLLALARMEPARAAPIRNGLLDTRWDPDATEDATGLGELMGLAAEAGPLSDGAWAQLAARADHDVWDDLPQVSAPTLVIGGRHDGISPPANLEAIAGRLPDARLELCDGGHLFLLQDPRAWPVMAEFLGA
ncbi:MAG: alpha/beta hydrolase [Acidimicrobiia bacterium]|nr:alpha/beta hydrolase [Acidimicrobiia bacterium]MDH5238777.1 alpha/beta hydrolase [Acidimicrobiia bacterium]